MLLQDVDNKGTKAGSSEPDTAGAMGSWSCCYVLLCASEIGPHSRAGIVGCLCAEAVHVQMLWTSTWIALHGQRASPTTLRKQVKHS